MEERVPPGLLECQPSVVVFLGDFLHWPPVECARGDFDHSPGAQAAGDPRLRSLLQAPVVSVPVSKVNIKFKPGPLPPACTAPHTEQIASFNIYTNHQNNRTERRKHWQNFLCQNAFRKTQKMTTICENLSKSEALLFRMYNTENIFEDQDIFVLK